MSKKMVRRACKCAICGASGYNDEFYRVSNGKKNTYYCSKEEYESIAEEKQIRLDLLRFVSKNIWLHDSWHMIPYTFQGELGKFAKVYGWEVVDKTIRAMEKDLHWACTSKNFFNDFAQSRYLTIMIDNNINKFYEEWKEEQSGVKKVKNAECLICGRVAPVDELFNKDGRYYCSEEELQNHVKNEQAKIKLLQHISKHIWKHDHWNMLPKVFIDGLEEMSSKYNWEVVAETIKQQEKTLAYQCTLNDKFANDYNQAKYLLSIIDNNISKVNKKWKLEKEKKEVKAETSKRVDTDMLNDLVTDRSRKKPKSNDGIAKFLD